MSYLWILSLMIASCAVVWNAQDRPTDTAAEPALRTHKEFQFTVHAPMDVAAPLFGANEERKWAPEWNPRFLNPLPAKDEFGAVFQIQHANGLQATWVMTAADFKGGHIQYVYVLAETMTTLIDIHLAPTGASNTAVHVVYERVALKPEANAHVQHLAKYDGEQGPEWEAAIGGYLKSSSQAK